VFDLQDVGTPDSLLRALEGGAADFFSNAWSTGSATP